ncbi:hypothetical protein ABH968_000894 [Lysinibacillus sp. RC79]
MSRLGQQDVGHEGVITGSDAFSLRSSMCSLQGLGPTRRRSQGVITGCDALSLRSPIADPQGVAQPPLQSTYIHGIRFNFW